MSDKTAAQQEFDDLVANNSRDADNHIHPEDRAERARERQFDDRDNEDDDQDEEERYRASKIDDAMRMPSMLDGHGSTVRGGTMKLPPASFDSGRCTGVKGVIADARNYENARRSKWSDRVRSAARRSFFGGLDSADLTATAAAAHDTSRRSDSSDAGSNGEDDPEERFREKWWKTQEERYEAAGKTGSVRNRRTSPSARIYGRMEEVDALGYLDAIEKVGRETMVVVFVYDHESQVSAAVESALRPLVQLYPAIRFVKVHYEELEFEEAGVPAILGYTNQGDLKANLTAVVNLIPDDEDLDSDTLAKLFRKEGIL